MSFSLVLKKLRGIVTSTRAMKDTGCSNYYQLHPVLFSFWIRIVHSELHFHKYNIGHIVQL